MREKSRGASLAAGVGEGLGAAVAEAVGVGSGLGVALGLALGEAFGLGLATGRLLAVGLGAGLAVAEGLAEGLGEAGVGTVGVGWQPQRASKRIHPLCLSLFTPVLLMITI